MPVFFISPDAIRHGTVIITGPLLDHLRASLRTQDGEELWFMDGLRQRYRVRVKHIDRLELRGQILEQKTAPVRTSPTVTLGQAMLKGERMEWVVQKATELGIAALVPLLTARVITRPRSERLKPLQARWQRIALEASQQAERWDIPVISSYLSVSDFFATCASTGLRLILRERESGESLQTIILPAASDQSIVLAVGPEGGWEQEELHQAAERGFIPVTLGTRVLRAETAAIAATSILQSRLGEL
jgi:16S rRNA (uracil1498-N3)-methyltransferase